MRGSLIVLFVWAHAVLVAAAPSSTVIESAFLEFKAEFRSGASSYASAAEEAAARSAFAENMQRSAYLQSLNPLASFGWNMFADVPPSVFATKRLVRTAYFEHAKAAIRGEVASKGVGVRHERAPSASREEISFALSNTTIVDWRRAGAVTPVIDQGECGSCWAFATTGNIEGQWFISGLAVNASAPPRKISEVPRSRRPLTPLSAQQLVACDSMDRECDGGMMDMAFEWIIGIRKGAIVTAESYPYASAGGVSPSCRPRAEIDALPVGAVITGYTHLPEEDEDTLAVYVAKGPVAISVDAQSFQTYRSGIITNCIGRGLNHAVLAVGYDAAHNPPYWIIKNSWGADWGEEGFLRVAMGSNQCLVSDLASTATVPPLN